MIEIAILNGVCTTIRALTAFDENNCKPMMDHMPDPVMKNVFCSVYLTGCTSAINKESGYLEQTWSLSTTVTLRIHAVPFDKIPGSIYLKELTGLSPYMEKIQAAIHGRFSVNDAIQTEYDLTDDSELETLVESISVLEPFMFRGRDPKIDRLDDSDLHGERDSMGYKEGYVAIAMTNQFYGLKTITNLIGC